MTDLQCLCPGDSLNDIEGFDSDKKIILGPGLRLDSERILVTKPGVLRKKEPNVYWIDSHQKRVCIMLIFMNFYLISLPISQLLIHVSLEILLRLK